MTVGSSFRSVTLSRRYRQEEWTVASSNRSRSHLASNCSRESLQDLQSRHCCSLLSVLRRLRLTCLDLFCFPNKEKEKLTIGQLRQNCTPQVSSLCLRSSHWCRPIATLPPVTSYPTHYRCSLRQPGECIHLAGFNWVQIKDWSFINLTFDFSLDRWRQPDNFCHWTMTRQSACL